LSRIFEILSDTAAKAVYDNLRKARRKQIERNEALDAKRRKIKEDLERRENQDKYDEHAAIKKLENEIKRLREEGSEKVREQQELIRQKLSKTETTAKTTTAATLKVQ
jgi:DnaJ family protein C protein 17